MRANYQVVDKAFKKEEDMTLFEGTIEELAGRIGIDPRRFEQLREDKGIGVDEGEDELTLKDLVGIDA